MAFKFVPVAAAVALVAAVSNGTAIVTATDLETITSCAPDVTDCPAKSASPVPSSEAPSKEAEASTAVVTSTDVETITSCAPDVTDCPAKSKSASPAPSSEAPAPSKEEETVTVTSCPSSTGNVTTGTASAPAEEKPSKEATGTVSAPAEETTLVTVIEGVTVTVVGGSNSTGVIESTPTNTGVEIVNAANVYSIGGAVMALAAGALLL